ncbi:MAG: hypothetical protein UU15_C0034G0021, partial [Candidatus Levybacteria bacterium GW2011_GWC2_40_7]
MGCGYYGKIKIGEGKKIIYRLLRNYNDNKFFEIKRSGKFKLMKKTFFITIQITVDIKDPGITVPENYIGFSFETEKLLPDNKGKYFFSSSNKALIATLKILGMKSLRIGGNTADRPWYNVPDETDIDTFFAFVKRLDESTADEFVCEFGKVDYLFAGHEYFGNPKYDQAFLRVANKLMSYLLHPYNFDGVVFDGKKKHLFCYSDEMVEKYKEQSPH